MSPKKYLFFAVMVASLCRGGPAFGEETLDSQAALGLSGLAVRAGARSVLGTLWKVNDVAASKLMVAFYRELTQPGTSRATALRRAQMVLLKDKRYLHPGYWSPFLIISNWL